MQPAIFPRPSEARVDNPALPSAQLTAHAGFRARPGTRLSVQQFPHRGAARAGLHEAPPYSEGARG